MANEKKELMVIPSPSELDRKNCAITYIKDTVHDRKFEILASVPTNDTEAQERYKVNLSDLVRKGVVQLMYGLKDSAIKAILNENTSEEEKAKALQDLANEKTGERSVRTGAAAEVKAKAAKLSKLEEELAAKGKTLADLEKYIARLKG